ncbi:MAG: hypothetical protein KatS3mg031_1222 [Chitinophagales bacterium]|nr:MAG: hypothetical protein KatS3mg031_1222 [Chitinophagales bacterium]
MTVKRALLIFCAAVVLCNACKKPVIENSLLLPESEGEVRFTDTLTVVAYTVQDAPYEITARSLLALGITDDPELGRTDASVYIPFSLPNDSFSFPASLVLDSVVLSLRYSYLYGDSLTPQEFEVYEMLEPIVDSVTYKTNSTFAVGASVIGSNIIIPNTTENFNLPGDTLLPHLRIRLDDSFGQKLLNASQTDLLNEANFRNFFKGLYVRSNAARGGKGLVFVTTNSSYSRITLYAHDSTSNHVFRFEADDGLNHFSHDYSHARAAQFIYRPDSLKGDSLVFIKGLAGLSVKCKVPYLANLGNIAINKAELVLTQLPDKNRATAFLQPPNNLVLFSADEEGNPVVDGVTDQVRSITISGGTRSEAFDSLLHTQVGRYSFSLSRYYQEVIHGKKDYGIFIVNGLRSGISLSYVERLNAGRLVAGGSNHSRYAIKLNLTYTVIE